MQDPKQHHKGKAEPSVPLLPKTVCYHLKQATLHAWLLYPMWPLRFGSNQSSGIIAPQT